MMSQLYLWGPVRKEHKKALTYIRDLYFEKMSPVFANAEKEAEEYGENLWENAMSVPCSGDDYDDNASAEIAEICQDASVEKYEILSLMRYRNRGMWLSCMCQVWEQQLLVFLKQEKKRNGLIFKKATDFEAVKECFKFYNYDLEKMKCWEEIRELRLLVNVLKHGEGPSADRLRKTRPDYFSYENEPGFLKFEMDTLKFHESTLLEETLKICDEHFEAYYTALISFWDELPESMDSENLNQ